MLLLAGVLAAEAEDERVLLLLVVVVLPPRRRAGISLSLSNINNEERALSVFLLFFLKSFRPFFLFLFVNTFF